MGIEFLRGPWYRRREARGMTSAGARDVRQPQATVVGRAGLRSR